MYSDSVLEPKRKTVWHLHPNLATVIWNCYMDVPGQCWAPLTIYGHLGFPGLFYHKLLLGSLLVKLRHALIFNLLFALLQDLGRCSTDCARVTHCLTCKIVETAGNLGFAVRSASFLAFTSSQLFEGLNSWLIEQFLSVTRSGCHKYLSLQFFAIMVSQSVAQYIAC